MLVVEYKDAYKAAWKKISHVKSNGSCLLTYHTHFTMGLGLHNLYQLHNKGYGFLPYLEEKHFEPAPGWNDAVMYKERIGGKKVYILRGQNGARLFYDSRKIKRAGALPKYILDTIFGNGIHNMDNSHHLYRKELYREIMSHELLDRFVRIHSNLYITYMSKWRRSNKFVLYEEMQTLLAHTSHKWVGLFNFSNMSFEEIGNHYMRMIDAVGAYMPFPFHNNAVSKGKSSRKIIEKEISSQVALHRNSVKKFETGTPAAILADSDLSIHDVTVEIINLTRPCVAVAKFVAFAGHAAFKHSFLVPHGPKTNVNGNGNGNGINKEALDSWKQGDNFVNEVRRLYPFVPFLGGITKTDMLVDGMQVKKDSMMILDIHSVNMDSGVFVNPFEFIPDRFNTVKVTDYNYVPQGGGQVWNSHRCPGEQITVIILKLAVYHMFTKEDFTILSDQDFTIDKRRMPTIPKDGIVMVANV